jgi:hypothetical protein
MPLQRGGGGGVSSEGGGEHLRFCVRFWGKVGVQTTEQQRNGEESGQSFCLGF